MTKILNFIITKCSIAILILLIALAIVFNIYDIKLLHSLENSALFTRYIILSVIASILVGGLVSTYLYLIYPMVKCTEIDSCIDNKKRTNFALLYGGLFVLIAVLIFYNFAILLGA